MRLRLAALGILLIACGGPPQPTTAVRPESPQPVSTALRGPKLRVAVGQFGDMEATKQLLEEMGWKGMAPVIAE